MSAPPLLVRAAPHLKGPDSTAAIMWNVAASLVPLVALSTWFWGPSALLVTLAATAGALIPERAFGGRGTLGDGSAAITGVLLALTLPPGISLWMAFLGGAFGIVFGKVVFGGLGQNPFNPALLGRAFLQAAFPVALTTWPAPSPGGFAFQAGTFSLPFTRAAEAVTSATPLGLWKFEARDTPLTSLFLGDTGGSMGETSALAILVCGGYLALRGFLNWRIPVALLGTVAVFAALLHGIDPHRYASPGFSLMSGGLLLGAVYMATDPVTSPVTNRGCWIFAAGIGVLVVIIRTWGGLAEGVMYAILLMNALVPFLNRWTQPRVFGTRMRREAPA